MAGLFGGIGGICREELAGRMVTFRPRKPTGARVRNAAFSKWKIESVFSGKSAIGFPSPPQVCGPKKDVRFANRGAGFFEGFVGEIPQSGAMDR